MEIRTKKSIYLNDKEGEVIKKASQLENRKVAEFIRLAALEKAKETIKKAEG